jgi:hypothetical protein
MISKKQLCPLTAAILAHGRSALKDGAEQRRYPIARYMPPTKSVIMKDGQRHDCHARGKGRGQGQAIRDQYFGGMLMRVDGEVVRRLQNYFG